MTTITSHERAIASASPSPSVSTSDSTPEATPPASNPAIRCKATANFVAANRLGGPNASVPPGFDHDNSRCHPDNEPALPPGSAILSECAYEYSGDLVYGAAWGPAGASFSKGARWLVSAEDPLSLADPIWKTKSTVLGDPELPKRLFTPGTFGWFARFTPDHRGAIVWLHDLDETLGEVFLAAKDQPLVWLKDVERWLPESLRKERYPGFTAVAYENQWYLAVPSKHAMRVLGVRGGRMDLLATLSTSSEDPFGTFELHTRGLVPRLVVNGWDQARIYPRAVFGDVSEYETRTGVATSLLDPPCPPDADGWISRYPLQEATAKLVDVQDTALSNLHVEVVSTPAGSCTRRLAADCGSHMVSFSGDPTEPSSAADPLPANLPVVPMVVRVPIVRPRPRAEDSYEIRREAFCVLNGL